jgi:hypothetical protein
MIRMSCQPEVEADGDVDTGLIPVEPRVSWATGVFIREDGYVVTTHHMLSELLEEREERTSRNEPYTTACDQDRVKVEFFRTADLANAANGGEPTLSEDAISTRDDSRAVADVLFLKANTFGDDRLPFICAHELYQTDAVLEDLPILVRQIEIQEAGAFRLRIRDGLASSERGGGPASNFLLMDIPAQPGASGAAVVDESGRIVGLVHGYSKMVNPDGNDNYLIPYRLFDDLLRDYSQECAEAEVVTTPVILRAEITLVAGESRNVAVNLARPGVLEFSLPQFSPRGLGVYFRICSSLGSTCEREGQVGAGEPRGASLPQGSASVHFYNFLENEVPVTFEYRIVYPGDGSAQVR